MHTKIILLIINFPKSTSFPTSILLNRNMVSDVLHAYGSKVETM